MNRPPKVSVSNTSGLAGVAYWVNDYRKKLGLPELTKNDDLVRQIFDWVTAEYDAGRITIISDGELTAKYNELANDGSEDK